MIELINVSKCYNKQILFKQVNLKIDKPGIYSFIGDNGSGKTTLLNIIAKLLRPTKGKVVNKNKFTFIAQKVNLIRHLKIKEHFEMFKIDVKHLKKIGLYNKLDYYPQQLSQGQRQKIAVILSLYSSSSLIIADEPTSHLDKKSASLVMKELVKVSKNKIILLVSHDLEIVQQFSSRIYKVDKGEIRIIKDTKITKSLKCEKRKRVKFRKYINKGIRFYKKINFLFCVIFFVSFILLLFSVNFKNNLENVVDSSIKSSLDYNKFYLKQCEEVEKEIILKECFNLKEDKISILKKSEHKLGYNYDLFLNSLYDISKFNVISGSNHSLKEGRYPIKYNEIIANENYKIGDVVVLNSSEVLTLDKTDIYSKTLELKVVGIVKKSIVLNSDNYYLDYELVEKYLKEEYLLNNKKSLYDYFEKSEFNDYKYVLYFDNVDIGFLKDNKIDYLSSSYEYYDSLSYAIEEINKCLIYLNVIVVSFCLYYLIKLIKKNIMFKEDEIRFFKAMGISNKKIIKVITKQQKKLIFISFISAFIVQVFAFFLFLQQSDNNCFAILIIYFISIFINKKLTKKAIRKRNRV